MIDPSSLVHNLIRGLRWPIRSAFSLRRYENETTVEIEAIAAK